MLFAKYLEEDLGVTDIGKVRKNEVENYLIFTKERGKYSFASSEERIKKSNLDKRSDIGKEIYDLTINGDIYNFKLTVTRLSI